MGKAKKSESKKKLEVIKRKHVLKAIKTIQEKGYQWLEDKGYAKRLHNLTHFVDYEEEYFPVKALGRVAYKISTGKHLKGGWEYINTVRFDERFRLCKFSVVKVEPTSDEKDLVKLVKVARHMARKTGKSAPPPKGQEKPTRTEVTVSRIDRDPKVIAWILEKANGVCEVCMERAPFNRDNGDPYLEAHHIRPLTDAGPDTICNVVACCPNCHRSLHHATGRQKLRNKVISRIDRLQHW